MFGRIRQHFTRTAGTAVGLAVFAMLMASCSRDQPMEPTRGSFTPQHLLAPANDNFADATVIYTLPFSETVDISAASAEADEPWPTCGLSPNRTTAWYAFTPAVTGWIAAKADAQYWTVVAVYTGASLANLTEVGCETWRQRLRFIAEAGTTYYFQVDGNFGYTGLMDFSVAAISVPANDDLGDAQVIAALPFDNTVDITAASKEQGEPTPSCDPGIVPNTVTVWYAFTPTSSGSVSASATLENGAAFVVIAAYTGNSLAALTEVGCRGYGAMLTLSVEAGTTYYFQVGGLEGWSGIVAFGLDVPPPPIAGFWFNPSDPSVFDDVQFNDNSYDPAGVGIAAHVWLFGDGGSASGCCPTHRYAADGDYTVQLTVTTTDGRTASTSQVVSVKTYDLAITKFSVPTAGSVGQTRSIVVGVNNKRYTAFVDVIVFKSSPGGFVEIARTWTYVPVRPANRTTDVAFSYTFTARDREIGKVTFKAVAYFTNFRDALPGDNEAIAKPTKVNK